MDDMDNESMNYSNKVKMVLLLIKGLLFFLSLLVASILGTIIAFKISVQFGWMIICVLACVWLARINIK